MRLTHDDRMRAMRARIIQKTGTELEPVSEAPAQVTRAMVDRTRAGMSTRMGPLSRYALRSQGGMKAFLRTARAVQQLPSFGKGRRE